MSGDPDAPRTAEDIRRETDVPGNARAKVEERTQAAREKVAELRERVSGGGAAGSSGTARQGARQVVRSARENPQALAAAGAFVAGLLIGRRTKRS